MKKFSKLKIGIGLAYLSIVTLVVVLSLVSVVLSVVVVVVSAGFVVSVLVVVDEF